MIDTYATARLMLADLKAKKVSAREMLAAHIAQNDRIAKKINAVIETDIPRAQKDAAAVDAARAKGESLGPLAGLPMTIKDGFDVENLPAMSGNPALRNRPKNCADAAVVAETRKAGAVIWGKTNTPVMAGDWQTFNALYGTTNNPWDQSRTTGGSSGGAAAALAAGVTALEIGSDIGGSLRIPAGFCGTYSHKPTWGLVNQHGHVPPTPGSWSERDLNVIGPMARSARDLRLLMSVLGGGLIAPKAPSVDLKEAKIALWLDEPSFLLDPQARGVIEALAADLSAAGAEVTPIASPAHMPTLMGVYQTLLGATLGEDMPPALLKNMERIRPLARWQIARGAGPLSTAALALAYTATHREWMAADAVRNRLRHEIGDVFGRFDAILAPIAPVTAFAHDHRPFGKRSLKTSDGQTMPYASMLNWISLATALHLPATAIPAGLTTEGLPVGAQLIGPRGGDAKTLGLAQAIEDNIRGFTAPPMSV
jgi:amidase